MSILLGARFCVLLKVRRNDAIRLAMRRRSAMCLLMTSLRMLKLCDRLRGNIEFERERNDAERLKILEVSVEVDNTRVCEGKSARCAKTRAKLKQSSVDRVGAAGSEMECIEGRIIE